MEELSCKTIAFPMDSNLRNRWIRAFTSKNWTPTENSVVCSKHLDPVNISTIEDYKAPSSKVYVHNLKPPTLCEDSVSHIFKKVPQCPNSDPLDRQQMLQVNCAPGSKSNNSRILKNKAAKPAFAFPMDNNLRNGWTRAIKGKHLKPIDSSVLHSTTFYPADRKTIEKYKAPSGKVRVHNLGRSTLNEDAVPYVFKNLPHCPNLDPLDQQQIPRVYCAPYSKSNNSRILKNKASKPAFSFPMVNNLRNSWTQAIKGKKLKRSDSSAVHSTNFYPADIKTTEEHKPPSGKVHVHYLVPPSEDAVPHIIFQNAAHCPIDQLDQQQLKMVRKKFARSDTTKTPAPSTFRSVTLMNKEPSIDKKEEFRAQAGNPSCSQLTETDCRKSIADCLITGIKTEEDLDIGPTELQPPDLYFMLQPCKADPD